MKFQLPATRRTGRFAAQGNSARGPRQSHGYTKGGELAPRKTVPSVFLKLTTRNTTMDMTMSSARPNRVEVVTSVQRRRRWTPKQKLAIVKQTNEPGSSVSLVAREHGVTAAQVFQWRKATLKAPWWPLVQTKLWCRPLSCKKP